MRLWCSCWFHVVVLVFGVSGTAVAESDDSASDGAAVGWIALFDGKSLDGWKATGDATWEVANGEIRTAGAKPGFLMTTREYADFQLHVEFRAAAATNSGVFLRTALEPTDPAKDCYELNIAPPDNPFPTGSLVARKKVALPAERVPRPGEWRCFEVTVLGGVLQVKLDGRLVLEYDDRAPLGRGHIGLQSNQGAAAFRGIRVRELSP